MQQSKGNIIQSEGLKVFFQNVGIRINSVDLSETQKQANQSEMIDQEEQKSLKNQNYFLLARINQKIQTKNIDIHELYRKQDINRCNALEIK